MKEPILDSNDPSSLRKYLIEVLSSNVLEIDFTKKDGTQRKMVCTLQESKLPKPDHTDGEKPARKSTNESIIHVYDLEKNDWRSIIIDSIKSYELVV